MFENEPLTDFTVENNRSLMAAALHQVEDRIRAGGFSAAPVIDGKLVETSRNIARYDPSDDKVLVGTTIMAGLGEVERALESVIRGSVVWRNFPIARRAEVIRRAGQIMRERKLYLAALMVREAGKPWKEADADVAEAIDFCFYYAEQALQLSTPRRTADVPAEDNVYLYEPRGVCVVISPWNFPLAILCGMSVAALVCGNGLLLKPAEQTGIIGFEFARILLEAGVAPQALAFLPGYGEEIGRALVDSPLVDMICFTGSKPVGLEIIQRAAVVHPGQSNVKRVVAEMGGKNAIIVDEDADLDESIKGVIHSAFGFSGQKCSACSRVIVVGDAYEPFVKRLTEASADVISGKASDPATLLGPVIDAESRARIERVTAEAEKRHTLAFKSKPRSGGCYVAAAIFRDVPPDSPLWREEVFGPVIAVSNAPNFERAVELAMDSQYALTGGVFTRSPANIEFARRNFRVGNLYINRGCTGALVCRHPFGGSRMSGVGSKAGGPDYLLQFVEPRTITENTMRRGFAPS